MFRGSEKRFFLIRHHTLDPPRGDDECGNRLLFFGLVLVVSRLGSPYGGAVFFGRTEGGRSQTSNWKINGVEAEV